MRYSLTLALLAALVAPTADAQHVQRKVLSSSSVARKIEKVDQLEWSKSLEALKARARAANKRMLFVHLVGELDGGL